MPIRALLKSLLLALLLAVGAATGPAAAATKAPTAKVALGVKKQASDAKGSAGESERAVGRSTKPAGKAKKPAGKAKKRGGKKAGKAKKPAGNKAGKAKKPGKAKKAGKTKKPAGSGAAAKKASVSTPAPAAPAAPIVCADTALLPDAGNLALVRAALVCLHNQTRAENGLTTLAENGALAAAAAGHSNDMVERGYFAHDAPDGGTFVDRILAARYADADEAWTLGENLAWGTGSLSTPEAIMRAWMNSPGHRANILKPGYRELGLAVRLGTPTGAPSGITVSAEFGSRL